MRNFKKYFILSIFLLLLQGCSKKSDDDLIIIWHNMRPEEKQVLQDQINEFMKLNPGFKVIELYKETEEMRSGFIIAAIGGQGPDLIYGPSDQIGPFEEMQIIIPLDSLFEQEYFEKFNSRALIRSNGKIWQLADKLGNHLTLVYNKKFIQTPPKTDKELIELGKQNTIDFDGDGKIDRYGLVWNYTEPYFFIPFLTGFGGWIFDENYRPTLNTLQMINALNFIKDLRDKYKIIPNEADYDIADMLFKEGKAAMIINGDWSWSSYGNAGIDYGIAPLPIIESTGLHCKPMVAPKGYSINANVKPEKIKKIKKLLEFLLSPEKQLETASKVKTFPSRKEVYDEEMFKSDEVLVNSQVQIQNGVGLPIVTEMRAIWDAMRPPYQAVLGGAILPKNAAKEMQLLAERKIKEIREENEQSTFGFYFQFFLLALTVFLLFLIRKQIYAFIKNLKEDLFVYALTLPALIILLAVILYPFVYNVILSFSNMSLSKIRGWSIIGLHQYYKVFQEQQFYSVFIKTLIWTFINVFFHVTIGVALAILLNRDLPGKSIFRVLLILPWAIPQYITALTWRGMFNYEYGAINIILTKIFGLGPVEWLKSPTEAFAAAITTNIWLGFPFMMVIALGALQSIPQELYEAADIDGAKWRHKLFNITIPLIKPVMIPAIVLGVIWTFNNLNVIWLVSNAGEPSDSTHILVSYVYKAAFNFYRFGFAAAFSMIIFLILFAFNIFVMRKSKAEESVY